MGGGVGGGREWGLRGKAGKREVRLSKGGKDGGFREGLMKDVKGRVLFAGVKM